MIYAILAVVLSAGGGAIVVLYFRHVAKDATEAATVWRVQVEQLRRDLAAALAAAHEEAERHEQETHALQQSLDARTAEMEALLRLHPDAAADFLRGALRDAAGGTDAAVSGAARTPASGGGPRGGG